MTIPDPLVYASVGPVAASLVWAGRMFILSMRKDDRPPELTTVRVYKQIARLLDKQLSGRYMLADEARQRIRELERKIDRLEARLEQLAGTLERYMSEHRPERTLY